MVNTGGSGGMSYNFFMQLQEGGGKKKVCHSLQKKKRKAGLSPCAVEIILSR